MKKERVSKIVLTLLLFVLVSVVCPSYNNNIFAATAISSKSATLIKGQRKQLKITGTKKTVEWSSSKKSVATVTSKGIVTAKAKGTATITAKVGSKKYTCRVTVQAPVLNKTNLSIYAGKTYSLKLTGTTKKITWKSSNTSIATVNSNGKVTAKKAGTATITATVLGKKFNCKVTVKKNNNNKYSIYGCTFEYMYHEVFDYHGTAMLKTVFKFTNKSGSSIEPQWAAAATFKQNNKYIGYLVDFYLACKEQSSCYPVENGKTKYVYYVSALDNTRDNVIIDMEPMYHLGGELKTKRFSLKLK